MTFGNRRFVAVSADGEIDTSTNGMQWTSVWHHGNLDFTSVAYGGGHFVATVLRGAGRYLGSHQRHQLELASFPRVTR